MQCALGRAGLLCALGRAGQGGQAARGVVFPSGARAFGSREGRSVAGSAYGNPDSAAGGPGRAAPRRRRTQEASAGGGIFLGGLDFGGLVIVEGIDDLEVVVQLLPGI